MEPRSEIPPADEDYSKAGTSKLRFKPKRQRDDEGDATDGTSSSRKRSRRSRSDHHSSARRRRHKHGRHKHPKAQEAPDNPALYDDTYITDSRSDPGIDPDLAFRESLFDALADDEGAAYWEGVYGQPIHTYPNTKMSPNGELERMSEEEYAAYVRARMFEKTHQHIFEERERRAEAENRQKTWKERTRRMEEEDNVFRERVEQSLKAGEERKKAKRWKEVWARYSLQWDKLRENKHIKIEDVEQEHYRGARSSIPWPVESGQLSDVSKEMVEDFFRHMPNSESVLASVLKVERVRWHPDKMQQRFGGNVDADTMKAVTSVFQVIDKLWTDAKNKRSSTG